MDGDARLKIGLYSSYGDLTDRSLTGMSGEEYKKLLLETTDPLHRNHPDRFKRYLINGEGHCIGDYYTKVNGVSIWSWINNMINDNPKWGDVLQGQAK